MIENQKIVIRVANVPEAKTAEAVEEEWHEWMDDNSVVIFLAVDESIKSGLSLAVEFLQRQADLNEVKVGIKANIYESHQLIDRNLFDELWEDYAGRCVDDFPAVVGTPTDSYAPELVVTRPQDKVLYSEACCVWISYRPASDDFLYSAPIKYLGDMAENLFLQTTETTQPE